MRARRFQELAFLCLIASYCSSAAPNAAQKLVAGSAPDVEFKDVQSYLVIDCQATTPANAEDSQTE